MRAALRASVYGCLLGLLLLPACGGGGGDDNPPADEPLVVTEIAPGQGISIQQARRPRSGHRTMRPTWGRLLLDRAVLGRSLDLTDGFVSVVTRLGWAVVNVPVPGPGEPPHAIYFDLGLEDVA